MVRVIVNEGQGPTTYEFDSDRVTVGATADCDIVLSGPGTGGVQLTLEATPTGHRMIVLTGEVFHNEEVCEYQDLLHNDTLRIGESLVLYKNPDAVLPDDGLPDADGADAPDDAVATLEALTAADETAASAADVADLASVEAEAEPEAEAEAEAEAEGVESRPEPVTELNWDPTTSHVLEAGLLDTDDTEEIAEEESAVLQEPEGLQRVADRAELEPKPADESAPDIEEPATLEVLDDLDDLEEVEEVGELEELADELDTDADDDFEDDAEDAEDSEDDIELPAAAEIEAIVGADDDAELEANVEAAIEDLEALSPAEAQAVSSDLGTDLVATEVADAPAPLPGPVEPALPVAARPTTTRPLKTIRFKTPIPPGYKAPTSLPPAHPGRPPA